MHLGLGLGFTNQDSHSSGFVPTNYATLQLLHDPTASDSDNVLAVGSQITRIKDLSGRGYHSTQSAGVACPLTGRTHNGKPVFDFQGAQFMTIAAGLLGISNGDNTAFFVFSSDTVSGGGTWLLCGISAGGKRYGLIQNSAGVNQANNKTTFAPSSMPITPDTNVHVLGLVVSGSTVRVFQDGIFGTSVAASQYVNTSLVLGSFTGGSLFADGWVGDVQIFGEALPDSVIVKNCAQLLAKWS